MRSYLVFLGILILLTIASCSGNASGPSQEYVSEVTCGPQSKDLLFTVSNLGSRPLSLEGPLEGSAHLAVEVNGVELGGLANYCGRTTLAPHDVVKCRRPGSSNTDAGVMIKTGRELLFLKATNAVRATVGDSTHEMHVACN